MNKFLSFFLRSTGDQPETVDVASATPTDLAEALRDAAREIKNVQADKEWIESRLRGDIEALRGDLVEARKSIASRDQEVSRLREEVETEKASANEKARAMIAKAGHDPVAIDARPEAGMDSEHEKVLRQYRELEAGKERQEFRKKHAKILTAARERGDL